ncbi:MAG: hypothetical protein HPY85_02850 [Anaerolineae bacterium]|nr:hypothetical protein [Anaerolineae bacterium]
MANHMKQNNQFGIKFLLTTFSITLVLGFWNLFAKKAQTDSSGNQETLIGEPWGDTGTNDFILPTLVPLVWEPLADDTQVNSAGEEIIPGDIREVSAPTPLPPTQHQAPIIESVTVGQPQQPDIPQQPRPQPTSVTTTGSSK